MMRDEMCQPRILSWIATYPISDSEVRQATGGGRGSMLLRSVAMVCLGTEPSQVLEIGASRMRFPAGSAMAVSGLPSASSETSH